MTTIIKNPQQCIGLSTKGTSVGILFGNFFQCYFFSRDSEAGGMDGAIGSFAQCGVPVDVVFVTEGSAAEGSHAVDHYIFCGGGCERG